jgi:hypothetical protein
MAKGRRAGVKTEEVRKVEGPLSNAGILPSGAFSRIASIRGFSIFSWSLVIVAVCSLVAAYLMTANLSYGLPLFYHTDEPVKAIAAVKLARGSVPPRFNHPQFMLFFSAPFLYSGWALGIPPLLAARAAVATLGIATVGLLYGVGRYLGGSLAGAAAAILYATAPLAVVAAHDFKEDIPLAFWLTLQLLFLVRYLHHGRSRDLFLGAAALGGAIGTKYTGLLAAPLLVGAVLGGPMTDRRWRRLGIAAALAGVGFLVTTPSILVYPGEFVTGILFEVRHALFGHGFERVAGSGVGLNGESLERSLTISPLSHLWTYHLRYSLVPGFSIAGILLAASGVVVAVTKADRGVQLVAGAAVLFYLVLETLPLKPPPFAARYMVIVLPYAALLGGAALARAWTSGGVPRALIGLLFASTIGLNGFEAVRQVEAMRPDTRDQARNWIFRNLPPGARIIIPGLTWYTPFGGSSRQYGPYEIAAMQRPSFSELLTASLDSRAYLVVSSFTYQRHLDFPDVEPGMTRFYRMLFEQHTALATFSIPFDPLGFHNPTIRIYRLSETPSTAPADHER